MDYCEINLTKERRNTPMRGTVLVTGGAGFIGRSLVRQLAEDGYVVHVLDNFKFSNQSQLFNHPMVSWHEGSTLDQEIVDRLVGMTDHVIHLAAPSSFIMHEENDADACQFTLVGFKRVMEAMRKHGKRKIVWASTSAVYEEWGKPPRVPFHEGLPIFPPDSKAGCKWWCEQEAERYVNRFGFTSIAFRPFSVYGVGEHTKGGYANVTSLFVWAMMSGHDPVVWGDGSQTRDFIFVDDAARAFKIAMERDDLSGHVVLNLGFGEEHSFLDVLRIVGEELGVTPNPQFVDIPIQIYAHRLLSDNSRLKEILGFCPEVDLRSGIKKIIEATKNLSDEDRKELGLDLAQNYFRKLRPAEEGVVRGW